MFFASASSFIALISEHLLELFLLQALFSKPRLQTVMHLMVKGRTLSATNANPEPPNYPRSTLYRQKYHYRLKHNHKEERKKASKIIYPELIYDCRNKLVEHLIRKCHSWLKTQQSSKHHSAPDDHLHFGEHAN